MFARADFVARFAQDDFLRAHGQRASVARGKLPVAVVERGGQFAQLCDGHERSTAHFADGARQQITGAEELRDEPRAWTLIKLAPLSNLLDSTGKVLRRMPASGVLVAVSESGGAFAVMQTAGGSDWMITVFSAEGDALGTAPRPNRVWKPFKAPVMERKYELVETPTGAELYEMYANADGVRIVRWSK